MNSGLTHTLAITGSSGFLGRHLISACLSSGNFKLRLLTRNIDACQHLLSDKVAFFKGDLLKPESLKGFLNQDSTLVHLAYLDNSSAAANIQATRNLINAARQAQIKRVVHCSTAVVVGFGAKGTITEDTPPNPRGQYQQVKLEIERALLNELPPNIELAILRPTEIIGPGGKGLENMIKRLRNGGKYKNFIHHFILKSRRFNYVSVHNVVGALILLAITLVRQKSEIYNISDDDDRDNNYASVENIINSILGLQQGNPAGIGLPRYLLSALFKLLPNHSPVNRVYSYDKISSLGYRKSTSLKQAISEIVLLEKISAHS